MSGTDDKFIFFDALLSMYCSATNFACISNPRTILKMIAQCTRNKASPECSQMHKFYSIVVSCSIDFKRETVDSQNTNVNNLEDTLILYWFLLLTASVGADKHFRCSCERANPPHCEKIIKTGVKWKSLSRPFEQHIVNAEQFYCHIKFW